MARFAVLRQHGPRGGIRPDFGAAEVGARESHTNVIVGRLLEQLHLKPHPPRSVAQQGRPRRIVRFAAASENQGVRVAQGIKGAQRAIHICDIQSVSLCDTLYRHA